MGRSLNLGQSVEEFREEIERGDLTQKEAAACLGVSLSTFNDYYRGRHRQVSEAAKPQQNLRAFEHDQVQLGKLDPVRSIEELLESRRSVFAKKAAAESVKAVDVKVNIGGPIGILHFGDPHVDDDGTDVDALIRHTDYVRNEPGLFGGNLGDTRNNWVGRLARLWAEQSTSASEAAALLEWFVRRVDWLYLIGGNHDVWSGADDPITWIQKERNAIYTPSECRLRLKFHGGRTCTINVRHDFSGHSMWNPAHGVGRAVQQGNWDDIAVCGHRHVSGYMPLVSPEGKVCHALQVSSYKVYDRYAKEKGFRDQTIEPGVITIIDPAAKNPAQFVTVCLSVDEGVEYLRWKRAKAGV